MTSDPWMKTIDPEESHEQIIRRIGAFAVAAALQGAMAGLALAQTSPGRPRRR